MATVACPTCQRPVEWSNASPFRPFCSERCKLLDLGSCRCSDYGNRQEHVSDCVKLTPSDIGRLAWLPETCAYRLLDEGEDLRWWHPLISGTQETVFEAGVSIRGSAISEKKIPEDRFPAHIVGWIEKKRS